MQQKQQLGKDVVGWFHVSWETKELTGQYVEKKKERDICH